MHRFCMISIDLIHCTYYQVIKWQSVFARRIFSAGLFLIQFLVEHVCVVFGMRPRSNAPVCDGILRSLAVLR